MIWKQSDKTVIEKHANDMEAKWQDCNRETREWYGTKSRGHFPLTSDKTVIEKHTNDMEAKQIPWSLSIDKWQDCDRETREWYGSKSRGLFPLTGDKTVIEKHTKDMEAKQISGHFALKVTTLL